MSYRDKKFYMYSYVQRLEILYLSNNVYVIKNLYFILHGFKYYSVLNRSLDFKPSACHFSCFLFSLRVVDRCLHEKQQIILQ